MFRPQRLFSCVRFVLLSGLFLGLAGAGPHGQQAPPSAVQPDRQVPPVTFRVEINYVEVDAVVADKKGDFVSGLQQGDFQVFEDGKPQSITNFSLVEIPIERPETPLFAKQPIEPDVQSNVKPFDGRVYVIVLDDLHVDPMHTPMVRSAAKKFIQNALGANDVAAVVNMQGTASQDFTGNKRLLLAAVDHFMGKALRSATENKIDDYNMTSGSPAGATKTPRDTDDMERSYNATTTLGSLAQLAEYVSGIRGRRKAMVFFSEGIDYDINDVISNQGASDVLQRTRDVIASATRGNVSIYCIDPRGLGAPAGVGADAPSPPMDADPSLKLDARGMQDEVRLQLDSLRVLADETGGFAALNSNDFAGSFARIQKDNSSYYVLGYYPTNDRRDGKFRKIEVRVTKPGLEVRARKGYVAPRGGKAAQPVQAKEGTSPLLAEVLNSPLQMSGFRLTAFAAPFKGRAPNASVLLVVQTQGSDFAFKPKADRFDDSLELSVIAVDEQGGKVKGGVRHSLAMPLKPQNEALVARTGLRVTSRFDIPPGRYQLRIGALETNEKRTGSVYYDLEVPDFAAGPLSMSGVVLSSTLASATPTIAGVADDELRKALPGPPTATRVFRAGEALALLAEVYDNETKTAHIVDITASLLTDDGREVYKHADERSSSELGGGKGGYGYTTQIPLKGLAPGLYVVKVEARSRLAKGPSASRAVQIRVTP
jgi:VWFA-related protein